MASSAHPPRSPTSAKAKATATATSTATTRQTPSARLHHLDALRAGALLLGVVLHTVLGFVPGAAWLFQDARTAWWALPVMVVIHLFRMILFMMLAGYFGRMVLMRRGTGAYVRDRLVRIGAPLLAFWPLAVLSLPVVIVGGSALLGRPLPGAVQGGADGGGAQGGADGGAPGLLDLLTPGQLWFLLLLLEIILVVVLVRALLVRVLGAERAGRAARRIGRVLSSPAGLLLAALPYAAGLIVQGTIIGGIQEPTTLIPVPGASLAYGGAFLVGWFLQAETGSLERMARGWPLCLALAALLSALILVDGSGTSDSSVRTLVLVPLAGWAWVRGLLGLAGRVMDREVFAIRYLADASYWIYLLHLPIVVALGLAMAELPLPPLVKVALNLLLTTGILVLAYDLMVRSTWIGRWLNGHRRPRALLPASRRAARRPITP
ncbi:acyltransferase family protein [Brachybacterium sp. ACRRE]|uniref:acyltransferase family protein n=1 Tax=Brachybacterium sp. ACRRE TaxID=2918184 RepID=UPI001EF1E7B8|nr:acyltransferase family protein [Brachybacterium sp. ACRRE]MCG7309985.1 acyltransferase family protein [Brachybacterium sp. ACRRE]